MAASLPVDLNKVDPSEAWKPWSPTADEAWNRKWATHLFRRAAFGAKPAMIDRALKEGYAKTHERLLGGKLRDIDLDELYDASAEDFVEPGNLRVWWIRRILESTHPLREKLTLFWHNHFATSFAKVGSTDSMRRQNETFRKYALGKFRPFLLAMSKDPAMLRWLDSNKNVAGAPNENFAREVMELFSLGVGNYTEKDIREAARAFTGWHTTEDLDNNDFVFSKDLHDEGPKTVFGKTGNWNGDDIVRFCCDQPACARFLVSKLYAFLMSETPPPKGILAPLEERLRKNDYDLADLVGTMIGSRLFFSSHAYHKRVKWPVEFVINAYQSLTPGSVPFLQFLDPLAKMGQVLFAPPNVKGWRTGTDWLNSATLLARNNFSEIVALGSWVQRGGKSEPVEPEPDVEAPAKAAEVPTALTLHYDEQSAMAVAGSAAAVAIDKTTLFTTAPDGKKYLVTLPKDQTPTVKSSPPPPPPSKGVDPIVTLYASKPKDIPELVARMSELLYGERISEKQLAKIEKFIREPLNDPPKSPPSPGPQVGKSPKPAKDDAPAGPKDEVVEAKGPKASTTIDMDSPAFKARVREALHAMMCLPEYQLN